MPDKHSDPKESDAIEFFAAVRTVLMLMVKDTREAKIAIAGAMAIINVLYGPSHAHGASIAFQNMYHDMQSGKKDFKAVDLERIQRNWNLGTAETDTAAAYGEIYHRENPN